MQRVEKPEFADFEWDENKRQSNLGKSGIDFLDAAHALLRPHLELRSPREQEARTKAICNSSGRIIIVIFTVRGEACRIISAWPADRNEQRAYHAVFG